MVPINKSPKGVPKRKMPKRERIAIVDSQPSSRIGLSHFIKKIDRWEVAWASSTAEEALDKISKDVPDLMILEIQLIGKDGLEFIKSLMPLYPHLKILVHSAHSEEFYAERCLRAGAIGYLHKMDPMANFEKAVEKVLQGELYLNPRIARQALHSATHHSENLKGDNHNLHNLTDRELEVMILMAEGRSCHESADKLKISPRTVQVHRNNIRLKIGLESALQLHAYAVRFYGDISPLHHEQHVIPSQEPIVTNHILREKNVPKRTPLTEKDLLADQAVRESLQRVIERFP
jgi:DNA-binding NarL/FixJ family response regulator